MNIGIDIDDVLAKFMPTLVKFISKKLNKVITENDMTFSTHYGESWGTNLEETISLVNDFYLTDEFKYLEKYEFTDTAVQELIKQGHKLYAITSRPDILKENTLEWLNRHYPQVFNDDNLFFTSAFHGGKRTKGEIAKELNIDFFIEDDIKNTKSLIDHSVKVILINRPWNIDYVKTNPGILTAQNLVDSLKYIK